MVYSTLFYKCVHLYRAIVNCFRWGCFQTGTWHEETICHCYSCQLQTSFVCCNVNRNDCSVLWSSSASWNENWQIKYVHAQYWFQFVIDCEILSYDDVGWLKCYNNEVSQCLKLNSPWNKLWRHRHRLELVPDLPFWQDTVRSLWSN